MSFTDPPGRAGKARFHAWDPLRRDILNTLSDSLIIIDVIYAEKTIIQKIWEAVDPFLQDSRNPIKVLVATKCSHRRATSTPSASIAPSKPSRVP